MAFTSTGFPAELVREVFVGAAGKSSIAKLLFRTTDELVRNSCTVLNLERNNVLNRVGSCVSTLCSAFSYEVSLTGK